MDVIVTTAPSSPLRKLVDSPYFFWFILAIPAIPMMITFTSGDYRHLVHPTGEFAARFTIISLMLTPLVMLLPHNTFIRWLMARRRHIGVAAFFYAAFHTAVYLMREGTLAKVLAELPELGMWTGWVAMAIFVPLALTSNTWSLRKLGPSWKSLQRLAYAAALFTVAHWFFVKGNLGPALVHLTPLVLLEIYRIGRNLKWWSYRVA
jgi:sulfoxide reductase heme-binding subunit YedZ